MTVKEKILEILSETSGQVNETDSLTDIEEILENCYDKTTHIINYERLRISEEQTLKQTSQLPWAKYFTTDELKNLTIDEEFKIWFLWELVNDKDYCEVGDDPAFTLKQHFEKYREEKRVESEIIENLKDYNITEIKQTEKGVVATYAKIRTDCKRTQESEYRGAHETQRNIIKNG